MIFDGLLVASLAIAGVALLRLRPTTFIFAANQISVLRGLSHIEQFGQPRSQGFLPQAVFSLENLAIAQNIFLLSTPLLAVCVFLPNREPLRLARLPAMPRWALVLLGLFFAGLILSQKTILTHSYSDPDRALYGFSLSGGNAFLAALLIYEVVRRTSASQLSRLKGFGLLLGVFILTDYLKGSTGFATGCLIVSAFLILGGEPRVRRRWLSVGLAIVSLVALSFVIRGVRASIYEEGAGSVSAFSNTLRTNEEDVSQTGEGAEAYSNGVQYAAHVLECISLYEAGVSREWRSVYLPLVYTFQPSFVMNLLDVERPKEAAWELADYYIHGGGIFVLGELYWNGGYPCVVIVFAAVLLLCWCCDTRWRSSFGWLLMLCMFAPGTLQGVGYGFAQISRGAFNGLLALGCYWAFCKLRPPRLLHPEGPRGAGRAEPLEEPASPAAGASGLPQPDDGARV
jgi:hypothetical protein